MAGETVCILFIAVLFTVFTFASHMRQNATDHKQNVQFSFGYGHDPNDHRPTLVVEPDAQQPQQSQQLEPPVNPPSQKPAMGGKQIPGPKPQLPEPPVKPTPKQPKQPEPLVATMKPAPLNPTMGRKQNPDPGLKKAGVARSRDARFPRNANAILLTRGHKMTIGLRDTAIAFAEDFYWNNEIKAEVWLCLDTSSEVGEKEAMLAHVKSRNKGYLIGTTFFVHEYTTDKILQRYPRLQYARDHGARGWSDKSAGLGFHTEAITHWYIALDKARKTSVQHVWVFETDVAYSGRNITKLFQSYGPSTDFITQDCHDPGGWMHGTASTPEFQKLRGEGDGLANIKAALEARAVLCEQHTLHVDCGKPITDASLYVSVEAVQRFSKKMIQEMIRLNGMGVHSWSEQSGCTYAAAAKLTIGRLDPTHIGSPYTYFEPKRFTVGNFEPYYTRPKMRDRLYHPVKLRDDE